MSLYPKNAIILAPLSGFTDLPYRRSMMRCGAKKMFTEMIDAGSLCFQNKKTLRFLTRDPKEEWLGTQLVGSDHAHLKEATTVLNDYHVDVVDFNLGCPAPKVIRKGEGAALGQRIDDAIKAFDIIVESSNHPVSAKIRILDKESPERTLELCRRLEASGACAITIHGRVKDAFYSGDVSYDIINTVRQELSIQVIVNGGIKSRDSYRVAREKSGCDSVMLATGAMGNPWLFDELEKGEDFVPPTHLELADEMEAHLLDMIAYYGETLALKIGRKIVLDYLKGRGYPGTLKATVSHLKSRADLDTFINEIRLGSSEGYWKWLATQHHVERPLRPPF